VRTRVNGETIVVRTQRGDKRRLVSAEFQRELAPRRDRNGNNSNCNRRITDGRKQHGQRTDTRNGAETIRLSAACLSVWVQCHPCSGRYDISVIRVPVPDRSDAGLGRQATDRPESRAVGKCGRCGGAEPSLLLLHLPAAWHWLLAKPLHRSNRNGSRDFGAIFVTAHTTYHSACRYGFCYGRCWCGEGANPHQGTNYPEKLLSSNHEHTLRSERVVNHLHGEPTDDRPSRYLTHLTHLSIATQRWREPVLQPRQSTGWPCSP
jgi:hypothetical protein